MNCIFRNTCFLRCNSVCLNGVEVQKIEVVPIELFAKVVPACRYAVFTHRFTDGGFDDAFKIADAWLNNSENVLAFPFDIQCYDERFKGRITLSRY